MFTSAQYEQCDPTEDLCALGRCRHPVVSLYERCKELDYDELAEYVDELKKEKVSLQASGNLSDNTTHWGLQYINLIVFVTLLEFFWLNFARARRIITNRSMCLKSLGN